MLQLGNQARRSLTQAFVCASCRRNQTIGRTAPQLLGRPANICAAPGRQYSTDVTTPAPAPAPAQAQAATPAPEPDEPKLDDDSKPKSKPKSRLKPKPTKSAAKEKRPEEAPVANEGEDVGTEAAEAGEPVAEKETKTFPKGRKGRIARKRALEKGRKSLESDGSKPPSRRGARRLGTLDEKNVSSFRPDDIRASPVWGTEAQGEVPNLKYNLDRALFNPGVYQLQDFYSKVFNFDPYLGQIMPAEEFDYGALRQYVTSSKDTDLLNLTIEHKKKYTGSTSSMTSTLSHFHYLLSGFRPPNFDMLSHQFMTSGEAVNSFTRFTRAPVATFLHWKDGAYAIDADKEFDSETVLSLLGRSMEKLFTLDKKDHEKYRKSASGQLAGEAPPDPSVYHYTTIGDVLMRSQLDAHDERLPGTGMFDLKTRAVISVRMNIHNYKDGQGYEIRDRFGPFESFEREYYDMIRSAFLKYSLQARMGRMTGIYVAYHNTKRIFGFQYIPLSEMDHAVHGTRNMSHGDREYKASVHLLNVVLDKVTARFPEKTLRLFIEARPGKTPFMYIFAKPVSDKEVAEVQGKAQSKAERIALKMGDTSAKAEDEDNGEVALDDSTAIQESADASVEAKDKEDSTLHESAQKTDSPGRLSELATLDIWDSIVMQLSRKHKNYMKRLVDKDDKDPNPLPRFIELIQTDLSKGKLGLVIGSSKWAARVAPLAEAIARPLIEAEAAAQYKGLIDVMTAKATGTRGVVDYVGTALGRWVPSYHGTKSRNWVDAVELSDLIAELAVRRAPPEGKSKLLDRQNEPHVDLWLRAIQDCLDGLVPKKSREELREMLKADKRQKAIPKSSPAEKIEKTEKTEEASPAEEAEKTEEAEENKELLGLILSIRHKVNGKPVEPTSTDMFDDGAIWNIDYSIRGMAPSEANRNFQKLRNRRLQVYTSTQPGASTFNDEFREKLSRYNKRGISYRQRLNRQSEGRPVRVLGSGVFTPESVFGETNRGGDYAPWPSHRPRRPKKPVQTLVSRRDTRFSRRSETDLGKILKNFEQEDRRVFRRRVDKGTLEADEALFQERLQNNAQRYERYRQQALERRQEREREMGLEKDQNGETVNDGEDTKVMPESGQEQGRSGLTDTIWNERQLQASMDQDGKTKVANNGETLNRSRSTKTDPRDQESFVISAEEKRVLQALMSRFGQEEKKEEDKRPKKDSETPKVGRVSQMLKKLWH